MSSHMLHPQGQSQHFNMARGLAALGRGPDSQLVHMSNSEIGGLQHLAHMHGGSLTRNPRTGLVEAGWLSAILPDLIGAALVATGVGAPLAGLIVGAGDTAITGDWKQGLMAGLGAFGGGQLAGGLAGLGATGGAGADAAATTGAGAGAADATTGIATQTPGTFGSLGAVGGTPSGLGTLGTLSGDAAAPTALSSVASQAAPSLATSGTTGALADASAASATPLPTPTAGIAPAPDPNQIVQSGINPKTGAIQYSTQAQLDATRATAARAAAIRNGAANLGQNSFMTNVGNMGRGIGDLAGQGSGTAGQSLNALTGSGIGKFDMAAAAAPGIYGSITAQEDALKAQEKAAHPPVTLNYMKYHPGTPNPAYGTYGVGQLPLEGQGYTSAGTGVYQPPYIGMREGGGIRNLSFGGSLLSALDPMRGIAIPGVRHWTEDKLSSMLANDSPTVARLSSDFLGPTVAGETRGKIDANHAANAAMLGYGHETLYGQSYDPATGRFSSTGSNTYQPPLPNAHGGMIHYDTGGITANPALTAANTAPPPMNNPNMGPPQAQPQSSFTPAPVMAQQGQSIAQPPSPQMAAYYQGLMQPPAQPQVPPAPPSTAWDSYLSSLNQRLQPPPPPPPPPAVGPGSTPHPVMGGGHNGLRIPYSGGASGIGGGGSYYNPSTQTYTPYSHQSTGISTPGVGTPAYGGGFATGGMAHGGLGCYSDVGHLLRGPGDGMSDSIPAEITGGKPQQAALADGEFVIPADVVSHLGNGSTEAGSKRLYAMMDHVRRARTGKESQAPAIKPNKFMPA